MKVHVSSTLRPSMGRAQGSDGRARTSARCSASVASLLEIDRDVADFPAWSRLMTP